ncbi:MAG: DUF4198 domain-containing protein [bacterium]|nr:DUF4198 domain-containing protein [bacterium]
MISRFVILGLIFIVNTPLPVAAHDLRLESVEGGHLLCYGHPDGHDHHQATDGYAPDTVLKILAFDALACSVAIESSDSSPIEIRGDAAALCILTSTGAWCKTPFGTRNLPADEIADELSSWLSIESVKRLNIWTEPLASPLTQWLELTPLNDPFVCRPGDKLRLLVTYLGQPVEGATVSCDGRPRGLSDGNGRINIRLRHTGPQIIQAGLTLPLDSPRADETRHTANLNLELEER